MSKRNRLHHRRRTGELADPDSALSLAHDPREDRGEVADAPAVPRAKKAKKAKKASGQSEQVAA